MIQTGLEMPFPLSAETVAEQAKLATAIDKHNDACVELGKDEADLKATAEENWDASHERAAGKLRERKISLNADEIQVREAIDRFYETVASVDFSPAVNASVTELETAKADVTAGLVALGYVNGQVTDSSGSYIAGIDWHMLCRHPRVRAANERHGALSGSRPWHDAKGLNLQAMNRCKEKTAELKRRGVALLA